MDHGGRFQAQGGELGREGESEPWDLPDPLQALTAHILLTGLQNKIPRRAAELRAEVFSKVHREIERFQGLQHVG
jgi:hypothetical protein